MSMELVIGELGSAFLVLLAGMAGSGMILMVLNYVSDVL